MEVFLLNHRVLQQLCISMNRDLFLTTIQQEKKNNTEPNENLNHFHQGGNCSSSGQNYSQNSKYPTQIVYHKTTQHWYTFRHFIKVDTLLSNSFQHIRNEVKWPSQEEIDDLSEDEFVSFTECVDYIADLYLADERVPVFKHRSLEGKIDNINRQLLIIDASRNILKKKLAGCLDEYHRKNTPTSDDNPFTRMSEESSPNKNDSCPNEDSLSESFSDFDNSSDHEK